MSEGLRKRNVSEVAQERAARAASVHFEQWGNWLEEMDPADQVVVTLRAKDGTDQEFRLVNVAIERSG